MSGWGCSSVVDDLLSTWEALGLMPSNETNIEDGFTESHDQIDSMLKSVLYSL